MGKAPEGLEEAVDFTLYNLKGQSHALSDYRGKIIFLNFWATWCGPCRAEMPSMQKLYESWDSDKFVMLAVNVGESQGAVSKFVEKNGYTFPVLLDQDGKVSKKYLIRGIPTTFIIDEKGRVAAKIVGSREWTLEKIPGLIE